MFLSGDTSGIAAISINDVTATFGDAAGFALQILARIFGGTERMAKVIFPIPKIVLLFKKYFHYGLKRIR